MVRLYALCLAAAAASAPAMVAAVRPSPSSPSDPLLLSPSSFLGEGPSSTFGFMQKAGRLVPQLRHVPVPPEAKPRKALEGIIERMRGAPKVAAPAAPRLQPQVLPRPPMLAPKPMPRVPAVPKVGIALPKIPRGLPRAPLFARPPAGAPPRAPPPPKPEAAAPAAAAAAKAPIPPKAPAGPGVTRSPFLRLLRPAAEPEIPEKVPELPEPVMPKPGVDREAVLKRIEQEIKDVMDVNTKAKIADKAKLGARMEFPVEQIAVQAMSEMSNQPEGIFILRDITDAITGKQLVGQCTVRHARVLGAGGMGVVEAVVIADEEAARVLGAREMALKLTYAEVPQQDRSEKLLQVVTRGLRELFAQETAPLKAVAKTTGGKVPAQEITEKNGWALPVFEGKMGIGDSPLHFTGDFAFLRDIVLSKVMLGDASVLDYSSKTGKTVARLSAAAKEQICAQLIQSTANLHSQNLVHYDIKPDNILMGPNGKAYLADFGMTGPPGELRFCMSKLTPLYMDPMQASCARRQGNLPLDRRYDSWSIGISCYALMTNHRMPYGLMPNEGIVETLSNLDLSSRRGRAAQPLPHPESDLRKHGISGFWARTVAALLDRNRERRPTPEQLVKKYSYWPLGQEGNE